MLICLDNRKAEFGFSGDVFITLTQGVFQSLQEWVGHFKTEISGCGMVTKVVHEDKSVQYLVDEIFLPSEQQNTFASTDIDAEMVHKLMTALVKEGKDTARLKMHWHSHASMDVFHSGTDKDNYKDLNNGSFLVSLVMNRAGDILGGLHLYGEYSLDIKGVPVYVVVPTPVVDEKIGKAIKDLEAYTDTKKTHHYGAGYYGGMYNYGDDEYVDYSKMEWDKHLCKWVPKNKKKREKSAFFPLKETIEQRRKKLGEKFNARFEWCEPAYGADEKCQRCVVHKECEDYWVANC